VIEDFLIFAVLAGALFAAFWMSPRALAWCAAKMMARRDGLRAQRMAFAWHVQRFEEE